MIYFRKLVVDFSKEVTIVSVSGCLPHFIVRNYMYPAIRHVLLSGNYMYPAIWQILLYLHAYIESEITCHTYQNFFFLTYATASA